MFLIIAEVLLFNARDHSTPSTESVRQLTLSLKVDHAESCFEKTLQRRQVGLNRTHTSTMYAQADKVHDFGFTQ